MSRSVEVEFSAREFKKAFRDLVTDESEKGTLGTQNLREAISVFSDTSQEKINELIATVDPFNEGVIRFLEFVNMMSSTS